ncbi:MAG: aminoglycoside phosphotransferase family protein [Gammaproteobacteria bacterium]
MASDPLIADIACLLNEDVRNITLSPTLGGGNNRIFIVDAAGRQLVAKSYFRHPSDTRDRLRAEFEFLTYACKLGLNCVPRPIACSPARDMGLYEYIQGEQLGPDSIDSGAIDQAIRFFLGINRKDGIELAATLPRASEACFSVSEHFALVDRRISRLATIPVTGGLDREALEFVDALTGRWDSVKARIMKQLRHKSQDPGAGVAERCISPSDFGFQNAILRPTGEICFLDFEYAGWDDPAKMAGDFFCHPAVPVPMVHIEHFLQETMRFSPQSAALIAHARLLFPVFQTKWCCIILNDFLPHSAQRRKFADPNFDEPQRKRAQLEKAKHLLDCIEY